MNESAIYSIIRTEIISNQMLMHWITLIISIVLLAGVLWVERNESVISVFLPLLSLSWAASMVRFDFFIQRQGAYLRELESYIQKDNSSMFLWETWKTSVLGTNLLVPFADIVALPIIIVPTIYLLFGPTKRYFATRNWGGWGIFAWGTLGLLLSCLALLPFIPKIASKHIGG